MKKEELFIDDRDDFDIESFVATHSLEEVLQIEQELLRQSGIIKNEKSEE